LMILLIMTWIYYRHKTFILKKTPDPYFGIGFIS
jgi:hypothetical protein